MSEQPFSPELLEDLLSGRDRLLTSGEVAEVLNVNVNTLYLWRASGEVDLPFQRFITDGQKRGMIRYRYSDVLRFLEHARVAGLEPETVDENSAKMPVAGQTAVKVLITDEQELAEYEQRLQQKSGNTARRKQYRSKKKKDALADKPLEQILERKFGPVFVEEPAPAAEPAPEPAERIHVTPDEATAIAHEMQAKADEILAQLAHLTAPKPTPEEK